MSEIRKVLNSSQQSAWFELNLIQSILVKNLKSLNMSNSNSYASLRKHHHILHTNTHTHKILLAF